MMGVCHPKAAVQEDTEETELNIRVSHNEIYFYEDVTPLSVMTLCNHISTMERTLLKMQCDYKMETPPSIFIYIHSYGGDVYAGLSCMNTLEACRVPIVTVVDGFVASAATFILLGGNTRHMREHSHILIHQIRGETWGKYEELKDEMQNTDVLMETIQNIYVTKSNIPEDKIRKIIKKELTMTADKCLKYNLVDKII
jgi:ATP-dependent Clp endopeptidase proteolytic subunit ClpP